MFHLEANIIPHEARCFRLQIGHCVVNPSKLCKAGRGQDSIPLLDQLFNFLFINFLHSPTHLVGEDHRVETDVRGRILFQPVVVCHKVGIVGDPEAESVVFRCVAHNPNDGESGGQKAAKRHFQRMGGHLFGPKTVRNPNFLWKCKSVKERHLETWIRSVLKFSVAKSTMNDVYFFMLHWNDLSAVPLKNIFEPTDDGLARPTQHLDWQHQPHHCCCFSYLSYRTASRWTLSFHNVGGLNIGPKVSR